MGRNWQRTLKMFKYVKRYDCQFLPLKMKKIKRAKKRKKFLALLNVGASLHLCKQLNFLSFICSNKTVTEKGFKAWDSLLGKGDLIGRFVDFYNLTITEPMWAQKTKLRRSFVYLGPGALQVGLQQQKSKQKWIFVSLYLWQTRQIESMFFFLGWHNL